MCVRVCTEPVGVNWGATEDSVGRGGGGEQPKREAFIARGRIWTDFDGEGPAADAGLLLVLLLHLVTQCNPTDPSSATLMSQPLWGLLPVQRVEHPSGESQSL